MLPKLNSQILVYVRKYADAASLSVATTDAAKDPMVTAMKTRRRRVCKLHFATREAVAMPSMTMGQKM